MRICDEGCLSKSDSLKKGYLFITDSNILSLIRNNAVAIHLQNGKKGWLQVDSETFVSLSFDLRSEVLPERGSNVSIKAAQ